MSIAILDAGRSYAEVSSALLELIKAKSQPVIALSGAWGTGKTFLWQEIDSKLRSENSAWKWERIYLSLFGLNGIEEMKWRLIENLAQRDENATRRMIHGTIGAAKHIAASAHWSGKLAEHVASIVAPKLIENKLIVLDDLERASDLKLRDLLGFISEYSETNRTRFLLILNLDFLEAQDEWSRFRDKIIDVELRLKPSVDDAFRIAAEAEHTTSYKEVLFEAVKVLDITNIRVLRRVLRICNEVLAGRKDLPKVVQARVVPSLILFPAAYYHAIPDAPPLESLLGYGSDQYYMAESSKKERTPEELRVRELMQSVGIVQPDRFEVELAKWLVSGIPNRDLMQSIIDEYCKEQAKVALWEEVDNFLYRSAWDPQQSNQESLDQLRGLMARGEGLDPFRVTTLAKLASELGDTDASDRLVERWVKRFNASAPTVNESEFFAERENTLHPKIVAAIKGVRQLQHPPLSPIQAIIDMVRNSGWGDRETAALSAAKAGDFENALDRLSADELRMVFSRIMNWLKTPPAAEYSYMTVAAKAFSEACRRIVQKSPDSQLSKIIRREFNANGLSAHLDGQ